MPSSNPARPSNPSRGGRAVLLALIALAPFAMGMRRGDLPGSGCNGTTAPRELVLTSSAGERTVNPSATRTQDVPVSPPASEVRYRGDESSVLYAFAGAQTGELLIGRNYAVLEQFDGHYYPEPISRRFADLGLSAGAAMIRHYDRGHCSAFVPWESFRDQLKDALDRAVQEGGALPLGNSTLTPLLGLSQDGAAHSGDAPDAFRFTRKFSASAGPIGFYMLARIEGGFRATGGHVAFVPTSITVRNNDNGTDLATNALESTLAQELPRQLTAAVEDQLFQRLPAQLGRVGVCTPAMSGENARCDGLLGSLLSVTLTNGQARCHHRSTDFPGEGQCEFHLDVSRTQEYPEGFELVLAESDADQGKKILRAGGADIFRQYCGQVRPPLGVLDAVEGGAAVRSGTVRRFDAL